MLAPLATPTPATTNAQLPDCRPMIAKLMARHVAVLAGHFANEPRRRITPRNLTDLAFALRVSRGYDNRAEVEANAVLILKAAALQIEHRAKTPGFELDPLEFRTLRLLARIYDRNDREAEAARRLTARAEKQAAKAARQAELAAAQPDRETAAAANAASAATGPSHNPATSAQRRDKATERVASHFPALAKPIRDAALATAAA